MCSVKLKNKFRHLNAKRRVNPFPPQPARQDFTAAFQEQYLAGVLGGRIGLAHDLIHYSSGRSIISELRKGAVVLGGGTPLTPLILCSDIRVGLSLIECATATGT